MSDLSQRERELLTELAALRRRMAREETKEFDDAARTIAALATKTTPVDADAVVITDSAASDAPKRTTWTNIKAALLTYFSALFAVLGGTAGGQTLKGGTASGENLTLMSTNHATKGIIVLGASAYDEVNNRFGLKITNPAADFEAASTATSASRGILVGQYNSGAQGALFIFRKARNTRASPNVVVTGDFAGVFFSDVHDGTNYVRSAGFGFRVNGTVATGSVPQDLIISVGSAEAGSLDNERVRVNSVGDVGIGTIGTTPAARMHIIEDTLGDPVQRLQSTATNDDPTEIVYQGRVATTNNTVTTLLTLTVPSSATYAVEVSVVARRTGGSAGTAEDGAHYILRGVYQNVAGTATIIGTVVQTVVGESQVGWDATLDTTGATVRVRVTGATNNNITWHCTARVWFAGS